MTNPPARDDVLAVVQQVLQDQLDLEASLPPDARLIEDRMIDSLGLADVLARLEDELDVVIDVEDLVLEDVETPAALARLVASRRPTPG